VLCGACFLLQIQYLPASAHTNTHTPVSRMLNLEHVGGSQIPGLGSPGVESYKRELDAALKAVAEARSREAAHAQANLQSREEFETRTLRSEIIVLQRSWQVGDQDSSAPFLLLYRPCTPRILNRVWQPACTLNPQPSIPCVRACSFPCPHIHAHTRACTRTHTCTGSRAEEQRSRTRATTHQKGTKRQRPAGEPTSIAGAISCVCI
jgi:hypothetical protein